jgi:parallel beta-helix repeat protein
MKGVTKKAIILLVTISAIGIGIGSLEYVNFRSSHSQQLTPPPPFSQIHITGFQIYGNSQLANASDGGNGTRENPYVIENAIFTGSENESNGTLTESTFLLANTNAFVIIRNCSVSRSSVSPGAMYLFNVSNAVLVNNTFSSYGGTGIYVYQCSNITILDNLSNINTVGIFIDSSKNVMVTGNTLNYNDAYDVGLTGSTNITVAENLASYSGYGILTWNSSSDVISGNLATDNSLGGISIENSNNETISDNTALYNGNYGIYTLNSSSDVISGNLATDNSVYGFSIINCSDDIFAGNNVTGNGWFGINIGYSKVMNVVNNTIEGNHQGGIECDFASNTNITNNSLSSNAGFGIHVWYSGSVTLSGNEMAGCGIWIDAHDELDMYPVDIGPNNTVNGRDVIYYKNVAGLTSDDFINAGQVILLNCYGATIGGLNTSRGTVGILLAYCCNVTITSTESSFNTKYGIQLISSNFTSITSCNITYNNDTGICIVSSSVLRMNPYGNVIYSSIKNVIDDNNISFNTNYGVTLDINSSSNTFSGNIFNKNGKGSYQDLGTSNVFQNTVPGAGSGMISGAPVALLATIAGAFSCVEVLVIVRRIRTPR